MCPPVNDFLPFCPTDSGTNLPTESAYTADPDRVSGNKPGIASSKLNNKALRQGTGIAAQLAQMMADTTGTDILDDAIAAKLLSQMKATLQYLPPIYTKYTSGSGSHNLTYYFFIASGNATAGATYTNNAVTFTVVATVAAGTLIKMTGAGAPAVSGTLTKASGTGDATLSFYAVRAPLYMEVRGVGGGGGGAGSGTVAGTTGGTGGTTTFGATLTGAGGVGANAGGGGAGGAASGLPTGIAIAGGGGTGAADNLQANQTQMGGGTGGASPFGGAGQGASAITVGQTAGAGATNSGSCGGGGGGGQQANNVGGGGGGAGGYFEATINAPSGTYAYAVGAAGTAGSAGTNGQAGAIGGSGLITVVEKYQ